ncbi:Cytosine deaminase and related metal-dependent hydrolases [Shimwellia blattae]|nr:Cytosine deaminase and related metal-dependent hydrolases [Shimwellia blattae]
MSDAAQKRPVTLVITHTFNGLHWFFDHAETITERNIERVKALGGGIAVQHRMAFQGEYFVDRYGADAVKQTPPVAKMLSMEVPVGLGTDATRVASYNPWTALYWLVSGRTVGGLKMYDDDNRLPREVALELWSAGSAWFSSEQGKKGRIQAGQLADLVVLSQDYFSVEEEAIKGIESVMTLVDGKVVYAAGHFSPLAPPPIPVVPEWSPVVKVPGHYRPAPPAARAGMQARVHQCCGSCHVHGHQHEIARRAGIPVSDDNAFWGGAGLFVLLVLI